MTITRGKKKKGKKKRKKTNNMLSVCGPTKARGNHEFES